MKNILLLFILLGAFSSKGQDGFYLISKHGHGFKDIDNINFQILQDSANLMYFANRSGILVYDGNAWDFFSTPSAALSLAHDGQRLFVGCLNNFGKMDYVNGSYRYVSLSENQPDFSGLIYQVLLYEKKVIFVADQALFIYDKIKDELVKMEVPDQELFINLLFIKDDQIHINYTDGSIKSLNPEFKQESGFFLPDSSNLAFYSGHHQNNFSVAGTMEGNLYLFNHNGIKHLPQSHFFSERNIQLVEGDWLDSGKLVVGTVESGCFILDIIGETGKMDTIDFKNGLVDNEVNSLMVDKSGGIWISNEFGLFRISPNLPIRAYSHYPGLEGNLFELDFNMDRLMVSTSSGLYQLVEKKTYSKQVYYQKKPGSREPAPVVEKSENKAEESLKEEGPSQKKKFRLFGPGRKKSSQADSKPEEGSETEQAEDTRPGFLKRLFTREKGKETDKITNLTDAGNYIRREREVLQSAYYVFQPVEGLEAKTKQILKYHSNTLLVTNSGVFELSGNEATLIINEPVRYACIDKYNDILILSCYDRSVRIYRSVNDLWVELDEHFFYETILSIGVDIQGNVWLAGPGSLYKAGIDDNLIVVDKTIRINNQQFDVPVMTSLHDRMYFIFTQGYFYYSKDSLFEDTELKNSLGLPVRYLVSTDGFIWIYDGRIWKRINPNRSATNFEYLGLFPDIKFIHYDPVANIYWLITSENEIFKYDEVSGINTIPTNDLILRRIISGDNEIRLDQKITLDHINNTITFVFAEPDYLGMLKVEYQYQLVGKMEEWSDWSENNTINFNYLQPGKYSLKVRSRDSFGRIQESEKIEFRIKPPFWRQPWFYASQILFFGLLIYSTLRLKKVNTRFPFIVDALSIFTIIMIIEFIQSSAQQYINLKSTPVYDLAVNVVIAIFIFPVEQKLRKHIIGKKD